MFHLPGQICIGKGQSVLDQLLSPGYFFGFLSVMLHCQKRNPQTVGYKIIQCIEGFMEAQFSLKLRHD